MPYCRSFSKEISQAEKQLLVNDPFEHLADNGSGVVDVKKPYFSKDITLMETDIPHRGVADLRGGRVHVKVVHLRVSRKEIH